MGNKQNVSRYHGPLITDGVSLGYIKFSWISFFLSLFVYVAAVFNDKIGVLTALFLSCTLISLISILLSFIKRLIYHFQTFTYILIALIVLSLLLDLNFIGLMMCVNGGEVYSRVYSFASAIYVIIMLAIFIISCSAYSWYYLPKNQGKQWAFNQQKSGNKKREWLTNFGIIFGAVLLVPALLTGYVENVFGVFLGILMTSTLSAVFVDALYAAVYARKCPESK